MMIKDKITTAQLTVTIVSVVVGVGLLSFPNSVAKEAGVDGWIGILAAGIIVVLSSLLIICLGKKFHYQSLIEYGPKLLGRFVNLLLMLVFVLYYLFFVAIVVRMSADTTKIFLLDQTPVEIILLGILIMSTYLVIHGINPIARFNESLQPGIIFILVVVLLLALKDAEFGRNLPILGDGVMPVMKSVPKVIFSFLGFEILFFLLPFLSNTAKVKRAISFGIISVTFFYTFIMLLSIAVFGKKEVMYLEYPTVALVKNVEVPGTFIERLESIMMFVWIPFAITTIVILYYGASLITSQMLKFDEHRTVTLLFFPIIFLIAVLPENVLQISNIAEKISLMGLGLSIGLPLLLWCIYSIKKGLKLL